MCYRNKIFSKILSLSEIQENGILPNIFPMVFSIRNTEPYLYETLPLLDVGTAKRRISSGNSNVIYFYDHMTALLEGR